VKCPFCSAWSEVSETRGPRRRRLCANGHRFTTHEAVTSHSARKVDDRNRQAARLVMLGQTQTEVAKKFNMPRTELSRHMRAYCPEYDSRSAGQTARWKAAK